MEDIVDVMIIELKAKMKQLESEELNSTGIIEKRLASGGYDADCVDLEYDFKKEANELERYEIQKQKIINKIMVLYELKNRLKENK